jgi:hypothetical protein
MLNTNSPALTKLKKNGDLGNLTDAMRLVRTATSIRILLVTSSWGSNIAFCKYLKRRLEILVAYERDYARRFIFYLSKARIVFEGW